LTVGLLTTLLTFPVSGPVLGTKWVLERVVEEAWREVYDERSIMQKLAELAMLADMGELAPEEHLELEAALLERLAAARAAEGAWGDDG
jgi:hypothetical protein